MPKTFHKITVSSQTAEHHSDTKAKTQLQLCSIEILHLTTSLNLVELNGNLMG